MGINNLYVTYDEAGDKHFHINDEEVTEDEWTQQHPHLKKGNDSGRNGSSDSGNVAVGDGSVVAEGNPESQVRQGIRDERDKAKAQRSGSPGDDVGQRQERPEQA